MSFPGTRVDKPAVDGDGRTGGPSGPQKTATVLGAVRDDVRQTLRCAWLDPALDSVAGYPVFFTAAWSAVRPNVGKSFHLAAKGLRDAAVDAVGGPLRVPDLRGRLEADLGEEVLRRVEDCARAAHQATAKVQLVVHALLRAVRRERISGTGREESPVRRGIPEWQRWMSFQPSADGHPPIVQDVMETLDLPAAPATMRLLGRWPAALTSLSDELLARVGTDAWTGGATRVRRALVAGMSTLPHPIELQWMALRERGFDEGDRADLAQILSRHDAAMVHHTLVAAFAWAAFGAPAISTDH
jgi:hypothetical protein